MGVRSPNGEGRGEEVIMVAVAKRELVVPVMSRLDWPSNDLSRKIDAIVERERE